MQEQGRKLYMYKVWYPIHLVNKNMEEICGAMDTAVWWYTSLYGHTHISYKNSAWLSA